MPEHVTDAAGRTSRWALAARVLVLLWTVAVALLLPALAWLVEQVLVVEGLAMPAWGWPAASLLAALLVAAPNALLARLTASAPVRAVALTWLAGAALLALLGSLRAIPVQHTSGYALALALVAGAATVALPRLVPAPRGGWFVYGALVSPRQRLAPSVAAGLAALAPFAALAALGGPVDTLATALAAAAVGALAARLLQHTLWPALLSWPRRRQLWLGGLTAGVALLLLAAGTGGTGVFLLEMLVLPPLGFVIAALRHLCFDLPGGPDRPNRPDRRAEPDQHGGPDRRAGPDQHGGPDRQDGPARRAERAARGGAAAWVGCGRGSRR